MNANHQNRVDAVIDLIDWQLDGTGIMADGIAQTAVHAVDGADAKAGRVSVDAAMLDKVKTKLIAITQRSTADLQTIMWAKDAIKLLDDLK